MYLPKMTKAQRAILIAQMRTRYENGRSVLDLSRKYQLNTATTRNLLIEAGTKMRTHLRNPPANILPPMASAIVAAYVSGKSLQQLRREYKYAIKTMRDIIVAHGIEIRDRQTAINLARQRKETEHVTD